MNSTTGSPLYRDLNQTSRAGGHTDRHDPSRPDVLWPSRHAKPSTPAEIVRGSDCVNLGGLDFLSIRLVALCAELGCMSAAANACHISLSTASHRITNLEKIFNTRFFRRHRLGIEPTQAGAIFSTEARAMLLAMYSAERELKLLAASNS